MGLDERPPPNRINMTRLEIFAANETEMTQLGHAIFSVAAQAEPPLVSVHLEGDLGTGKTTLVRGFIRAMGVEGAIKSPTWSLMELYDAPSFSVAHLDLYRMADPEEVLYLGIEDEIEAGRLLFIEWPSKGQGILPTPDLVISIDHAEEGRKLNFQALTSSAESVLGRLREQIV